ncbi:low molecular weight protein-tyrosine-phosphatase [Paraglaciecola aquimarina]|uniref:Low molecular weight protein-tyrosine-phosphatase n=1 Tax=Paraglaciecola aquimarina TaxID=1235557 RepID=A0ABU3SZT6_9ALTE|nr:low molecular weight protein-tyrosine-phosphatase [Paraglaciecola aquimarina]MDU0355437.1 low molecular weight protein-tyrosine-phosphatase [Paraglaciecola aquimarina]
MADSKISVLFVCLGNICRSPSAEAVFKFKVSELDLDITVDSAGTAGYHKGAAPDKRAQEVGTARGYSFKGLKCRKVEESDFETFDYVIAMDKQNLEDLIAICPAEHQHKVTLFLSHCASEEDEVPDPYYGGKKGFEYVMDLIEQASTGLLNEIQARK